MNIFYDLQEMTRKMDEKHSFSKKSVSKSENKETPENQLPCEDRQKNKQKEIRNSGVLLGVGAIGTLVLLYLFIRLYIVIGDFAFNSSVFWIIAIIGFIGIALYVLFLISGVIYGSFSEAKSSGGRSVLALAVFFILVAIVFTLMNRCT